MTPETKHALLKQATTLTNELHRGSVSRSELEHVLTVLLYSPGPWEDRLKRAERLTRALPNSWYRKRSTSMPGQLGKLRSLLEPVLAEHRSEQELRFLLGWTSRMLYVAEQKAKRTG